MKCRIALFAFLLLALSAVPALASGGPTTSDAVNTNCQDANSNTLEICAYDALAGGWLTLAAAATLADAEMGASITDDSACGGISSCWIKIGTNSYGTDEYVLASGFAYDDL